MGEFLAVGVSCAFLASIPRVVLATLHSRRLKRIDYEGSPDWCRQLLSWRTIDGILRLLGLLYLGWCAYFVVLFLANASEDDLKTWAVTGGIAFFQDIVAIPFFVAFFLPLLATAALGLLSCAKKVDQKEIVQVRHSQMVKLPAHKWEVLSI